MSAIQDYRRALAANVDSVINSTGSRFFRLKSVSVPGQSISVRFDDSAPISMVEGDTVPVSFRTAILKSDTSVDVVLTLSDERVTSTSATVSISGVTAEIAVPGFGGQTLDTVVPALGNATIAAVSNTKSQSIKASSANQGFLKVALGALTGASNRGFELLPGEAMTIDSSVQLRVHNPNAFPCSFSNGRTWA